MRKKESALIAGIVFVFLASSGAQANVFIMGDPNLKSLQFVTVGDPGNAADTAGYGSVSYTYQMGKYDVTAAQYCQFLKAVATQSDPLGLYDIRMAGGPGTGDCGITRTGNPGSYSYTTTGSGYSGVNNGNFPVNYASWGDAARFCNWLANGQPTNTTEGAGTTETGSYALNGAKDDSSLMGITRNANATYVLPTENEWYKAAYYKGGSTNAGYWLYTTKSNTAPSNVLSSTGTNNANYNNGAYTDHSNYLTEVGVFAASPGPHGTYDMGGNVWQWTEANMSGSHHGLRGAAYNCGSCHVAASNQSAYNSSPTYPDESTIGFRIAYVPEPLCAALCLAGAMALLRRHAKR